MKFIPSHARLQFRNYPWKNTSILAFLDVGLSNPPAPLLRGLPPIPRGLPPTPEVNFLPIRADELLGRGWTDDENVPRDDVVDTPNCFCVGDGVPRDTDLGESARVGVSRGDGCVVDGDALYRGGVIVSVNDDAIGVISTQD
jgi:hypothetical protein